MLTCFSAGDLSSLAFFSLPPRTTPLTYCRGSGAIERIIGIGSKYQSAKALSENYTVGSRVSGFGSGKDVEAGVFE